MLPALLPDARREREGALHLHGQGQQQRVLLSVCVGSRPDVTPWVRQWISAAVSNSRAASREVIAAQLRKMACRSSLARGGAFRADIAS